MCRILFKRLQYGLAVGKKLIEFSRTEFSRTISYTTDRASENTKIAIFLMNYFIYLTVVHEIHDFKQRFSFFFFLEQEV